MDLTLVKVPGKKKRGGAKSEIAARKALNRPRGRALQPPQILIDSKKVQSPSSKKVKKRTMKTMKSRRKMSDLEKLPTELLENVFLYCMNLDLARSSPIIGGKLSSDLIYNQTIVSAFGSQWETCVRKEHNTPPQRLDLCHKNGSHEEIERKRKEHSAILKCRWATLPVILRAKDFWIQKSPTDRFVICQYFPHIEDESADVSALSNNEITAREFFEKDFERFSNLVLRNDVGRFGVDFKWTNLTPDTSNGIEIPHSILLGPWSEEVIRRLFWVVKSGARLDWITSSTGEVALLGLKNAISIGNTRVVHLLEWAGLADRPDADTLVWALRHVGGDKIATINHLFRTNFGSSRNVTKSDMKRVYKEIHLMRDEAREDNDDGKLAFVEQILNSEAYLASFEAFFM